MSLAYRLQQKAVARHCADWLRAKAEIRSIRQANFLHGKLYHIDDGRCRPRHSRQFHLHATRLGLAATSNIELNLVVDSDRDRADLKAWFDEIWDDEKRVEDVKARVLQYLEQLYVDPAPEFVYFKTLFHIFEKFLAGQADGGLLDQNSQSSTPRSGKRCSTSRRTASRAPSTRFDAHNGCILADSVGLGKTFTALAVIKYFELRNERGAGAVPEEAAPTTGPSTSQQPQDSTSSPTTASATTCCATPT
ncbi:MAG: hypothetical protein MZV65_36225 [Chromatiales bacterium]|nr:hypothetical protein [Chromatiales bacterium]